ncbi:uncharacterized protein [Nicotiana sylvestris]|uniref:uncharacterized protein n=1 Tax=Nicotiana sylvestris TaxID=4096 RepID=UPI00388C3E80
MSRFVRVRNSDLIPSERIPFLEEWNMKCLGDTIAMRPPLAGEEEIPKPPKEKKRKRESPAATPKPKKSTVRKPKADIVALSPGMTQRLRDQEEENDDDCLLVARKRGSTGASKCAEPEATNVVHPRIEEISKGSSSKVPEPSSNKREPRLGGHLEETLSKSRAELARCEAELKKILEERDGLKTLYVKKEEENRALRADLAKACQERTELTEKVEQLREELKMKEVETLGWRQGMDSLASEKETIWEQLASLKCQLQSVKEESLAQGRKIEELKAKSAAELAKAKSDAEAIISSYRADTEVANAQEKKISYAAEVKLSSANTLEEEVVALLSNDEDSASGSDSRGDEDEDPEDEALENAAPKEDAVAEDVAPE